jgi:beta-lactamase superfamily II metal-dependent hydrolase
MGKKTVKVDLARVYETATGRTPFLVLSWGDVVEEVSYDDKKIEVKVWTADQPGGSVAAEAKTGFLKIPKGMTASDVLTDVDQKILKLNFVDVQQGDACVIESPAGKVVLVDGGQNQMFARYLAARFRGSSEAQPREIDAIVVTHGDADHFEGLSQIHRSETNPTKVKQLFIHPKRIFHNGLFKRPGTDAAGNDRSDKEMLNDTVAVAGKTYLQPLVNEVTKVPKAELNKPFTTWVNAIEAWRQRDKPGNKLEERRLQLGDDAAFDFLKAENIEVEVLGPITEDIGGKPALKFLGDPPKGPKIGHDSLSIHDDEFGGHSASHTINGHSIVLRVAYGGFSFLLTGDLNDQSERYIVRKHNEGKLNLRADVLKAPHHGSADFSPAFLQAVGASVAIISSGDESEQVEYIHPRATLVGALGRYSRAAEPIVLCTEMVAFFKRVGPSKDASNRAYYGFERTAYGLVKTRTDGKRLLVVTSSGKDSLKEAYAFDLDEHGAARPAAVRTA